MFLVWCSFLGKILKECNFEAQDVLRMENNYFIILFKRLKTQQKHFGVQKKREPTQKLKSGYYYLQYEAYYLYAL